MALQRLTALALMGALALGATSCGDDPKPSASTPTATASASPSSTGPAAPVMPHLAKRNDAVGAKAFVKFYFAALTHAMKTGDTELMDRYAAKECEACAGIGEKIHKIYDAGGRNDGGGWTVSTVVEAQDSSPALRHLIVIGVQPKQRLIDPAGKVRNTDPQQRFALNVWVDHDEDAWSLRDLQAVAGATR